MPTYSPNRAKPSTPAGQNNSSRDRGMTGYMDMSRGENKAKVQGGRLVMAMNEAGQHARRAPKSDILR